MAKNAVIIGAGNIGRGFIGQIMYTRADIMSAMSTFPHPLWTS